MSVNPSLVRWESRWTQDAHRIRWLDSLGGPVRCRAKPVLVYDPHLTFDCRHATRIAAETPSTLVPVPFGSHPVTTFLTEVGLLRMMIENMLNDRFDPVALAQEIRARRGMSSVYLGELAERQPKARARTAIALARAARAAQPGNPLGMLSLARVLTRNGNHDEAIALHREIAVLTGRMPLYLAPFAEALLQAGARAEAITVAEEVVAARPEVGHLRHWLAKMQWKGGTRAKAIVEQKRAVELEPTNRRFRNVLLKYRILILFSSYHIMRLFKKLYG